jgi:selenium donor protein
MNAPEIKLTSLAHGGGCGCKLAPSVLQQLLTDQPAVAPFAPLLVGTETADDAAVWQLDENTCVIATTDFFMPMVDDAFDFGRIAATNAISDVYAMGGRPIMALAILGMPIDKLPTGTVCEILKGGAAVCAAAGIPVAGGHSIDCPEPVYGLAVIGTCRPEHVRRNSSVQAGDALILTKPVGVGIYSAAIKNAHSDEVKAQMAAGKSASKSIEAAVPKDVVRAYWANVARIKARLAARKIGLLQVSTDTVGALLMRHPLGDGEHIDSTGHAKLAGAILPQVLAAIRK